MSCKEPIALEFIEFLESTGAKVIDAETGEDLKDKIRR